MQPAIDHIMTSTAQGDKTPGVDYTLYTNIHSSLYNYFTNRCNEVGPMEQNGKLPGHEVYDKLEDYFQDTCRGILLAGPEGGADLVLYIVSTFQRYNMRVSAVERLINYVNRHYVKRAVEEGKGWMALNDALAKCRTLRSAPNEASEPDERTISQIKLDAKLLEMKRWGYEDGDSKERATMAEACAEAASSVDRIVPVLSLARRRFRTEVFEPLLVSPKPNDAPRAKNKIKTPPGPPPYRPKGRLARAVQTYNDSRAVPISESKPVLSALDLALSTAGVRQETHIRKRLRQLLSATE
ncbi:hypothetical protein P691DRAFT_691126, partial [Macrolepiota fuliginosa MF-IS2]